VEWPLKTRCCGGSLTGTITEVGVRLGQILLREAVRRGADVITTNCPLCQLNLECFQKQMNRMFGEKIQIPVLYFSQLLGLALGIPQKDLGFERLFMPFQYVPPPTAPIQQKEAAHA
jgi:heterodisulfide reductase subunit B